MHTPPALADAWCCGCPRLGESGAGGGGGPFGGRRQGAQQSFPSRLRKMGRAPHSGVWGRAPPLRSAACSTDRWQGDSGRPRRALRSARLGGREGGRGREVRPCCTPYCTAFRHIATIPMQAATTHSSQHGEGGNPLSMTPPLSPRGEVEPFVRTASREYQWGDALREPGLSPPPPPLFPFTPRSSRTRARARALRSQPSTPRARTGRATNLHSRGFRDGPMTWPPGSFARANQRPPTAAVAVLPPPSSGRGELVSQWR